MRALYTAATGMAAQELNVEVISNNIANLRTTGFKKQRAAFQDLIYDHVRRVGAQASDQGTVVPVGVVTELVEGDIYHWGSLMAGALFGSLPVAILYSFFVEYYVSGLTGAVKE